MAFEIGIIAAVSLDDGLAQGGRIPWDEPADRAYFAARTRHSTVVMGRGTWASLPHPPLPDRVNFVLTRHPLPGVRCFDRLDAALAAAEGPVWLIGGAQVYREGYARADLIELTRVPVRLGPQPFLRMPPVPTSEFEPLEAQPLPNAPHLVLQRYRRRQL